PLAEPLAIVVLRQEGHRDLARQTVERPAHHLVPFLGLLHPRLDRVRAVEALPGEAADEAEHRDRDEDFQEGEAADAPHCVSPSPPCAPSAPAAAARPSDKRLPLAELPPGAVGPTPSRASSCEGSSCTSGFRISARQAKPGAPSSSKLPRFSSSKSEKPSLCSW